MTGGKTPKKEPPKEGIDSIIQRAYSLSNTSPVESRKLAEQAEELAASENSPRGTARAKHLIALYHLRSGDLQAAVEKSREALEVFQTLGDEDGLSSTLNTLGIAYRNTGSFDRGLDCLMGSLKIEQKRNDPGNLVKLYGNIGNIFDSMGQYPEGLKYYTRCLELAEVLDDSNVKADACSNLGTCYHHLGESAKSASAHRKALKIREALDDQEGISFCLNNLGMIYESQGKHDRALKYYLRSLDIKVRLGMKLETARICNTIGSLFTTTGDYEAAAKYLEKGSKLAREVGSQTALRENHICLSNHYGATGSFELALAHHRDFHRLDRQILNSTRIARMEAQLELMHSELYAANAKLEEANSKLSTLSITDGLTGISNRRRFDEFLAAEWNRCRRRSAPVSLVIMDIDFFKLFNDTRGHTAGDNCLRLVAEALDRSANRATDLVARFGGEEFAAVLSETGSEGAIKLARKARRAVENLGIPHESSEAKAVITISIGIATIIPSADTDPTELIRRADDALYYSKAKGRNRITMFES